MIGFMAIAGVFAAITGLSCLLVTRQNRRLSRQNIQIADHLERLTFAFVAKIPDALSDTVLYDKLGQRIGIQRLVVDLYDRVMGDPDLRPYFTGVDMDRLRAHQVSMYSALFGIEAYKGMDLTLVHADLNVADAHFSKLLQHVNDTLNSFGLAPEEITTVVGWLESQRSGIVTREEP